MKKNYTLSLESGTVQELKEKFAVNLSNIVDKLLSQHLIEITGKRQEATIKALNLQKDTHYESWFDELSLGSYNRLKTSVPMQNILKKSHPDTDLNDLFIYLKAKYP